MQLRLIFLTVALAAIGACGAVERLQSEVHFGSRPQLPAGVTVAQDFERGADGFAVDIPSAFERYYACIDDVELVLGDPGLNRIGDAERELYALLCAEAAGNGWFPGNRPDEARVLNEQAIAATGCVRDRGWDYPDPVSEQHGRFLEIADPATAGVSPDEPGAADALARNVSECLEATAIDWSQWVIENPRN